MGDLIPLHPYKTSFGIAAFYTHIFAMSGPARPKAAPLGVRSFYYLLLYFELPDTPVTGMIFTERRGIYATWQWPGFATARLQLAMRNDATAWEAQR